MYAMFFNASVANPDVSNWNVSAVTDMGAMFYNASVANPNVSNWNVSAVTNMGYMFREASVANPDVSNWNVSAVTDMGSMFNLSNFSNTNYDLLLASWSLLTLQTAVNLHAGSAQYTETTARLVLTDPPNSWTITDGGAL
jgi:surface protein